MFDILSSVLDICNNILHSPVFQSNLFNFVVMVFILYKLAAPFIKKAINDSAENTKKIVETSDLNRAEAEKQLSAAKEKYEETPQDIDYIVKTATNTLNSLEKKAEENTQKEKITISSNADKSIKSECARLTSQLTSKTALKSVCEAKENIIKTLNEDESLHDRLIEQSIDELELSL